MANMNVARTNVATYGMISVMGLRRDQMDTVTVVPNLINFTLGRNNNAFCYDFFGVYDGHDNNRVSNRCKTSLHNFIVDEVRGEITRKVDEVDCQFDWKSVMDKSFERMEEEAYRREVLDMEERDELYEEEDFSTPSGSTAIVVMVGKEDLVVANCGNCRAVLGRDGVPIPLSRDHTLEDEEEKARVEVAGADLLVTWEGPESTTPAPISRIIGDHHLKQYIIWEPEVRIIGREMSDEFLIIGSDGLWNKVSNDTAYQIVKSYFDRRNDRKHDWAAAAATALVTLSISRSSKDNISVLVVDLQPSAVTDTSFPT